MQMQMQTQTHDFTATLQFGIVSAIDAASHSLRVKIPVLDDMETDWLPMATPAAGGNRFYSLPDVGELVVCLLDARGETGCVIGAIYNAADKPPVSDQNKWVKRFTNGTVISHDRRSGEVVVETPGKVKIKAAQKVDIQSPETEITGNATVNGLLTYYRRFDGQQCRRRCSGKYKRYSQHHRRPHRQRHQHRQAHP